jgi:hypothetical protein
MVRTSDRLKNFFPSLILRSPLHQLMSGKYAIIEFTGRKSGRVYTTPVAYVRDGDRVLLSTDSHWWGRRARGGPGGVGRGGGGVGAGGRGAPGPADRRR